jgi:hypothetical protein
MGALPAATAARRMVPPPRKVTPDFTRGGDTPRTIDIGPARRLKFGGAGISFGVDGVFEVDIDDDGASFSSPFGGASADRDGVSVNGPNGGGAHLGPDGASVRTPGGGGISVDDDGSVRITPPGGRDDWFPDAPGGGGGPAPIPYPNIAIAKFDLPIQLPKLKIETVDIVMQIPKLEFERVPYPIPIPIPKPEILSLPFPVPGPGFALPPPRIEPEPLPDPGPPPRPGDPLALAFMRGLELFRPNARFLNLTLDGAAARHSGRPRACRRNRPRPARRCSRRFRRP